ARSRPASSAPAAWATSCTASAASASPPRCPQGTSRRTSRRGIESGPMPPHDLGRKSLLLLGSTWGSTALGMAVSVLIGRVLGPAALGSIGFSTGMVGLLMAALLPGFARAHLKRLSEGQDAGRCVGTMAAIQLALQVVLVVGLLALHYQIA